MEGLGHLSLDQVVRSAACHGSVAPVCGPVLLVVGHEHPESAVRYDDADRSGHGRPLRPLSPWRGSFKAAWPTVAKLAGGKAKNMLNYSSFYGNFGVEDNPDDDSIAPLGEVEHAAFLLYWLCKFVFCTQANKVTLEFAHLADYLAQGGRLALSPFLLGHIYRTLHDVVTDGMKPKHGGPLWAFQFWLQAYFPELRAAPTERTGSQFRVCLTRPFPLFLTHDLSIIPDGETENDLREIWGSFLVPRDLHCGLSKAGAEVYLPHFGRCRSAARRGRDLLPAGEGDDFSYLEAVDAPASAVAGARKTLARRTVPSPSPVRPTAAPAPGRKRGREAVGPETAAVEAASVRDVVVEMLPPQRPKKRALLVLSEGEDEGDVPATVVEEEASVAAPDAEEVPAAEEVVQEAANPEEKADVQVEEEAEEEEDVEMLEAEKGPAAEQTVVELSDGEILAEGSSQTVLAEVPSATLAVPSSTAPASTGPSPFIPRRPGGIRIGLPPRPSVPLSLAVMSMPPAPLSQESVVVTALTAVEGADGGAPSLLPVSSGEAACPDDLESLFASLHGEGGSSSSAPLDEESKAIIERLREFLLCDAHQMTTAEAFLEFSTCLDAAMAMGLLDSAQLDELQEHLAEGEEMLGRCAEASGKMNEGCLLEQELSMIKEQVRPTMARLKENDLVIRRENEELAQVEAQVAELQARRSLILQVEAMG
ncbi:unnamed protein product [Prunus brigantina]